MVKETRLRYFPIGLFISVMGFAGLTLAVRHAEGLYELNHFVSTGLLGLTSLLFLLNTGMLLYRLMSYRADVLADFNHPLKMNFFGAISISLLLIAVALLEISETASFVVWLIGALLQIGLTVMILSRLIWTHAFTIEQFNPAWLIPIVGTIIVPIAGTQHAPLDVNWMFFSVGLLFSIIYFTLFISRMYFHPGLPPLLQPTFFILLAPPAIGFVAYMKLAGELDGFGSVLYGIALFIFLLLVSRLKPFLAAPFSLTWWAFLFPTAAMTLATAHMEQATGAIYYHVLLIILLVSLIVLASYLTVKTLGLVKQKKLCLQG